MIDFQPQYFLAIRRTMINSSFQICITCISVYNRKADFVATLMETRALYERSRTLKQMKYFSASPRWLILFLYVPGRLSERTSAVNSKWVSLFKWKRLHVVSTDAVAWLAVILYIVLTLCAKYYLNMDGLTAVFLVSIALSLWSRNPPPYYSNADAFNYFLLSDFITMHDSC